LLPRFTVPDLFLFTDLGIDCSVCSKAQNTGHEGTGKVLPQVYLVPDSHPAGCARSIAASASTMSRKPSDGAKDVGQPEAFTGENIALKRRREQIRTSQRRFRNRQRTQIEALQNQVVHLENVIQDAVDELLSLRKDPGREGMVARATRLAQMLDITVQDSSALLKASFRQAQSALFSQGKLALSKLGVVLAPE
jgi:hypothetical protein